MGLIVGSLFFNVQPDRSGVRTLLSASFISLMFLAFGECQWAAVANQACYYRCCWAAAQHAVCDVVCSLLAAVEPNMSVEVGAACRQADLATAALFILWQRQRTRAGPADDEPRRVVQAQVRLWHSVLPPRVLMRMSAWRLCGSVLSNHHFCLLTCVLALFTTILSAHLQGQSLPAHLCRAHLHGPGARRQHRLRVCCLLQHCVSVCGLLSLINKCAVTAVWAGCCCAAVCSC